MRTPARTIEATTAAAEATFRKLGFRNGIRENIFIIRGAGAILDFRARLLADFRGEYGPEATADLTRFLDDGVLPADELLVRFVAFINRERDRRRISRDLAGLVSGFVGAEHQSDVLLDTGYFRVVLPPDTTERLSAHPAIAEQRRNMRDKHDYEMNVMASGALAHRDIQAPHYSTQANLWFPLHKLEASESLLLFPNMHDRRGDSYSPRTRKAPEDWGFGEPFTTTLEAGDAILFHSETFHCSPIKAGARPRISVELRFSAACPDDNAMYRRLFWNLSNFHSPPHAPLPVELFNRLFTDPEGARLAAETLRTPAEIRDLIDCPEETALATLASLMEMNIGEDLRFFGAKAYFAFSRRDQAAHELRRLVDESSAYFWRLEACRLAAEQNEGDLARAALTKAREQALAARPRLEPVGRPDPCLPSFHILPRRAIEACDALERALESAADRRLIDFRFFTRQVQLISSHAEHDIYKFELLYAAIPPETELDPAAIVANGKDILVDHDIQRLRDRVGPPVSLRPNRSGHLNDIRDNFRDWHFAEGRLRTPGWAMLRAMFDHLYTKVVRKIHYKRLQLIEKIRR